MESEPDHPDYEPTSAEAFGDAQDELAAAEEEAAEAAAAPEEDDDEPGPPS